MRKTFRLGKSALAMGALWLGMFGVAVMGWAGDLDGVKQLVVSVAPSWNASGGRLQCFRLEGRGWVAEGSSWPVLYGRSGLVWGRGVLGNEGLTPQKVERDGRSPAGVFRVGKIYTYDAELPRGADYPFRTVGEGDAWIDDPLSANYNRHLVIDDLLHPPAWFAKGKMRHGDFAYRWLVEIRHNSDPPVAGAGSAIFFHIRRGENRPSSGCTTMAEGHLRQLIGWLRVSGAPHYVLLPAEEYRGRWKEWGLPSPEVAAELFR